MLYGTRSERLRGERLDDEQIDFVFDEIESKRFNDHTGRPDRLDERSRSSREARSVLVGPGPRQ
jgi:hypothetical protein